MGEQGEQSIHNEEHLLCLMEVTAVQIHALASQGQHENPSMNAFSWFNEISEVKGKVTDMLEGNKRAW